MKYFSFTAKSPRTWLVAFAVLSVLGVGIIAASSAAYADEGKKSSEDEFIQSSAGVYLRSANIVVIDEDRDQDAFVAGSSVTLQNSVQDFFAAGSDVVVDGTVNGSLRAAGNTVTINGTVKGNVMVFASTVRIGKDAVLEGHVNVYGATVLMEGAAKKSFEARGESVTILGSTEGETYIEAATVTFGDNASVASMVYVEGPNAPTVKNEGVEEKLVYTSKALDGTQKEQPSAMEMIQAQVLFGVYWFIALSLIGVVMLAIWGDRTKAMVRELNDAPWSAFVKGMLFLCATPVIILLSALTIVGIPLALFVFGVYVALLTLSSVAVGVWLGTKLLPGQNDEGVRGMILQFLVGSLLLAIVGATPFVGWIVSVFVTLFGAGAIIAGTFSVRKK